MEIYYAPHNEIINNNARIFIVGITPGWTQTSIAYKTAHDGLMNNLDYETIKKECKRNSRFAGSMRKNLIEMLIDEYKPDAISVEELFYNNNAKAAINVAIVSYSTRYAAVCADAPSILWPATLK